MSVCDIAQLREKSDLVIFMGVPLALEFRDCPGWNIFADMLKQASTAIQTEFPHLKRVLGGISPVDPAFLSTLKNQCFLSHLDVVAVHGFPLDWNHWTIHEWPSKLDQIRARDQSADLASASGFISRTIALMMPSALAEKLGVKHLRTGLTSADSFRPERGPVVRQGRCAPSTTWISR